MKNKSLVLGTIALLLTAVVFLGCPVEPETKTEYVDRDVEVPVPTAVQKDIDTYGYGLLVKHTITGADAVHVTAATLTGTEDLSTAADWSSSGKVVTISFGGVASGNITLDDTSSDTDYVVGAINAVLDANADLYVEASASSDGKYVVLTSTGIPADFTTNPTPAITVAGSDANDVFGSSPNSVDGAVTIAEKDTWTIAVLGVFAIDDSDVTIRINGDADSDEVASVSDTDNIGTIATALAGDLDTAIGAVDDVIITEYDPSADSVNVVTIAAANAGVVVEPITSISLSIARP